MKLIKLSQLAKDLNIHYKIYEQVTEVELHQSDK